jgi:hypothetical protein
MAFYTLKGELTSSTICSIEIDGGVMPITRERNSPNGATENLMAPNWPSLKHVQSLWNLVLFALLKCQFLYHHVLNLMSKCKCII